jgi:hypothetical protein
MSRQHFCNAPAAAGSCYCARHQAMAVLDPDAAADER